MWRQNPSFPHGAPPSPVIPGPENFSCVSSTSEERRSSFLTVKFRIHQNRASQHARQKIYNFIVVLGYLALRLPLLLHISLLSP